MHKRFVVGAVNQVECCSIGAVSQTQESHVQSVRDSIKYLFIHIKSEFTVQDYAVS
jgi:hypothetical protein